MEILLLTREGKGFLMPARTRTRGVCRTCPGEESSELTALYVPLPSVPKNFSAVVFISSTASAPGLPCSITQSTAASASAIPAAVTAAQRPRR